MKVIRLKAVLDKTGLGKTTIYKLMKNGIFPLPVNLGLRAVGWVESEVDSWLLERPRQCIKSLSAFSQSD